MKKALTSGLVLLVLGLVCGLVLAVVNYFTAPIIAAHEREATLAALGDILGDGWQVSDFDGLDEVQNVTAEIGKAYYLKVDGTLEVVVYSVTTTGYASGLNLLIAVDSGMKVLGYQVLSDSETVGIGKSAIEANGWNMVGATLPDTTRFQATAGATKTSNGILNAFVLVAERASIDFGGGN